MKQSFVAAVVAAVKIADGTQMTVVVEACRLFHMIVEGIAAVVKQSLGTVNVVVVAQNLVVPVAGKVVEVTQMAVAVAAVDNASCLAVVVVVETFFKHFYLLIL